MKIRKQILGLCDIASTTTYCQRYPLHGVHFYVNEDGRNVAVATDGHRLVKYTWDEDKDGVNCEGIDVIVPVKMCRAARSWNADVELQKIGSNVQFSTVDRHSLAMTVMGVPLDGTFPKDDSVIPEYDKSSATVVSLKGALFTDFLKTIGQMFNMSSEPDEVIFKVSVPIDTLERPLVIRARCDGIKVEAALMQIAPGSVDDWA